MPKHIERSPLIQLVPEPCEKGLGRLRPVILYQSLPSLRLRSLYPGQRIGREQRPHAIVLSGITFCVQPAVIAKVLTELDPLVETTG